LAPSLGSLGFGSFGRALPKLGGPATALVPNLWSAARAPLPASGSVPRRFPAASPCWALWPRRKNSNGTGSVLILNQKAVLRAHSCYPRQIVNPRFTAPRLELPPQIPWEGDRDPPRFRMPEVGLQLSKKLRCSCVRVGSAAVDRNYSARLDQRCQSRGSVSQCTLFQCSLADRRQQQTSDSGSDHLNYGTHECSLYDVNIIMLSCHDHILTRIGPQ
jgi:hypothetical protein